MIKSVDKVVVQGVERQSTSPIATYFFSRSCSLYSLLSLVQHLPCTAFWSSVHCILHHPVRQSSSLKPIRKKNSESKPPTSSKSHPEDSCLQNSSHSISGSSQQRSSAAKMSAILCAIVVPSRADYGMQDQKPLLPLHGARRAFF